MPTLRPLSKADFDSYMETDPILFANITRFLGNNLVLNGPEGAHSFEISEVEGFRSLVPGRGFEKQFDGKVRTAGEIWVSEYRGNAMINIVVDPETKQVIAIKKMRHGGKNVKSVQAAITEALGIPLSAFTDKKVFLRTLVENLDGVQTLHNDEEARAKIGGIAEGTVTQIAKVLDEKELTSESHSIGKFSNQIAA